MAPINGKTSWMDKLVAYMGLTPDKAWLVKVVAFAVVVGILALEIGPYLGFGGGSSQQPVQSSPVITPAGPAQDELVRLEQDLARRLEQTLSLIRGAGTVRVLVTLEEGPAITPVTSHRNQETTTKERATEGSTRETTQLQEDVTPITTKGGSNDALAVLKRSGPKVAGVLIVADGAKNKGVQAQLHAAAVTALGISADHIRVVAAEGR